MIPLLQATDISKCFLLGGKANQILNGVDFSIEEGEFVCIVGPSGCGKSTFLELMAGITKPDEGSIRYKGNDITGCPGHLGYMPQDDLLFPWLNLLDNILLPVRIRNGDLAAARDKVVKMLPEFGLEGHGNHLPYQLSGGLRQRAAFLRTYMTGADILLLDEPFASLDAITRRQMQIWLHQITRKLGTTVILVTHDIEEAILLAGRIQVMRSNPGTFTADYCVDHYRSRGDTGLGELHRVIMQGLQLPADIKD